MSLHRCQLIRRPVNGASSSPPRRIRLGDSHSCHTHSASVRFVPRHSINSQISYSRRRVSQSEKRNFHSLDDNKFSRSPRQRLSPCRRKKETKKNKRHRPPRRSHGWKLCEATLRIMPSIVAHLSTLNARTTLSGRLTHDPRHCFVLGRVWAYCTRVYCWATFGNHTRASSFSLRRSYAASAHSLLLCCPK